MIYIARRPLRIGDEIRPIGAQVPEAENWLRADTWERVGFLDRVPGEYDHPLKTTDIGVPVAGHVIPKKKAPAKRAAKKTTSPG